MPIWLRKFTFNEILNHHKKQSENTSSSNSDGESQLISPNGDINKEAFKKVSKNFKGRSNYK